MAHGNHVNSVWSNSGNVETLKRLVIEGLSASQIAKEIGCGLSRNAVIGKIFRMGLGSTRVIPANHPKTKRQPRVRRVPSPHGNGSPQRARKSVMEPVPFVPAADTITPLNLDLDALTATTCRWPYGDGPFTFCGHHAPSDKPYCASHSAMSYEHPKSRRGNPHFKYVVRRKNFSATAIIAGAVEEAEAA